MKESQATPNRNHINVYPPFNVFFEKLSRKESKLDRPGGETTKKSKETTASHKKDFELVMFAAQRKSIFTRDVKCVFAHVKKGRLKGR